jgi:hypothetical protein
MRTKIPVNTGIFGELTALITAWLEVRVLPGPPRIPTFAEISRPSGNYRVIGRLIGAEFVSAGVSMNLLGTFCRLRLRAENLVSRKQRLWFEETRFECKRIVVGKAKSLWMMGEEWELRRTPSDSMFSSMS